MSQALTGRKKKGLQLKVAMIGDTQIGKTSLMVKYVEGKFSEDYIQTLGVNFMEKTIHLKNAEVTFSIWDLGGQKQYMEMLPLVCNEAHAILFMFDLARPATLDSVRSWFQEARKLNRTAASFLVGTKYDLFAAMKTAEQALTTKQARRFAKAMKASLIFCSAMKEVNVTKLFKMVLARCFRIKCKLEEIHQVGDPIFEYMAGSTAHSTRVSKAVRHEKPVRGSSTDGIMSPDGKGLTGRAAGASVTVGSGDAKKVQPEKPLR